MQVDSETGMNWQSALAYCEGLSTTGYNDWRLPNTKELQSIVDYSRSPATTNSAAIDPLFSVSTIKDEGGNSNYPFYWTSTTHATSDGSGGWGVYIAFGEALGFMSQPNVGNSQLMDVHGAGAQRSDPKTGDSSHYPEGHGPQGDVVRIDNYVRCVRDGDVTFMPSGVGNAARPTKTVESTGIDQNLQGGRTDQPAQQGGLPGRQPPQEALRACSTSTPGTTCQLPLPSGEVVNGTCQNIQQLLACVPANSP
jgi:hypothetical protein